MKKQHKYIITYYNEVEDRTQTILQAKDREALERKMRSSLDILDGTLANVIYIQEIK